MPGSTEDNSTPVPDGTSKQESRPDAVQKSLANYATTILGTIAVGAGGIIVSDLQHRQPLMFAALGLTAAAGSIWLYILPQWRKRRSRMRASRAAPDAATQAETPKAAPRDRVGVPSHTGASRDPARSPAPPASKANGASPDAVSQWPRLIRVVGVMCALVSGACALVAGTFFLGYWTLGNGFAHGILWGLVPLQN